MKKLFSLALVMVVLTSMLALVGCNGLWGFDEDDDVVGPASPNWKLSKKVELPDTTGLENLRAQVATSGYGKLVARVFNIADRKEMTKSGGIQVSDDGKVTLEFLGDANATYTVEISHPTKLDFFMACYFNQLENNKAEDAAKPVNATSTAIAQIASQSRLLGQTVEFSSISESDPLVTKTAIDLVQFFKYAAAAPDNKAGTVKIPEIVLVTGVKIKKDNTEVKTIEVKKADPAFQLTAEVSPSNATIASVTWSVTGSSDVVSVDQTGMVTIRGGGKATITVTTNSLGKTATCEVTVVVPVESIALNKNTLSLDDGKSEQLTVVFTPTDATVQTVTWSAAPAGFVEVTNGLVKALKPTTSDVTVTATSTDGNKTATCLVTVKKVSVTGVSIDKTLALGINGKKTLVPVFQPEYVSDRTVKWESSNAAVATVSEAGEVSALTEGTAVIKVTTNDGGFTAECTVTVTPKTTPVVSVKIEPSSVSVAQGGKTALKFVLDPPDATNTSVTWTSSNESIAKVSTTGEVTGVAIGSAQITVTTADGGKTAKCEVSVVAPPALVLNTSVTTGTTTGMQIKITDVDEAFLTSVVLKDVSGVDWTFSVNESISKLVPGVVLKVAPQETKFFVEFKELKFTNQVPKGARVAVTQEGSEVAFVVVQ